MKIRLWKTTMKTMYFNKRSGTTDYGKDYEDLVVAHLALKYAIDKVTILDRISSNDKNFGSFDDVILEVTPDAGVQEKYALQLKHIQKEQNRGSLLNMLSGSKGNFSLKRYFEDYKDKKELYDSFKLLLYTNKEFDIAHGQVIRISGQNFDVEILKTEPSCYVSETGNCFKFKTINVEPSAETQAKEYDKFFNHFFLYTNQWNVKDLKQHTLKTFKNAFDCKDLVSGEQYLNFISQWSKSEYTKRKLTREYVRRVIALQLLHPFIRKLSFSHEKYDEKTILIKELVLNFNVIFAETDNCCRLQNIWSDCYGKIEDEANTKKQAREYQITLDPADDEAKTKLLWLTGTVPLIADESHPTYHAINLCPDMKFVVVGSHFQRAKIQTLSVFENLSDLDEKSSIYPKLLKTFKFKLQGREKCSLQTLIGTSKKVKSVIGMNELIQMSQNLLEIGEEKEVLPEAHVPRYLTKNIISYDFLKSATQDTFITVSCLGKYEEIKEQLKDCTENVNIVVGECSMKEFDSICKTKSGSCHHLKVDVDGQLEWVYSTKGTDHLQKFQQPSNSATPEVELLELGCCPKVEVICGVPGMGKTTLLKSLKNNFSEAAWKVIIYTKEHFSYFHSLSPNTAEVDDFQNYIIRKLSVIYNPFDKKLLKVLKEEGRIAFFWDGLDEIPEAEFEVVTCIIRKMSEKNIKQFVTARGHMIKPLEEKLAVLCRTIRYFNEDEQHKYIQQRLHCPEHLIDKVIARITDYVSLVRSSDLMGIPLQISMLVELFNEDCEKYINLSETIFSMAKLYQYSVEEKLNICWKKAFNIDDCTSNIAQIFMKPFKQYYLDSFEQASLKVILHISSLKMLEIDCEAFLKDVEDANYINGIITGKTENGKPRFLHQSYAEYFIAMYFAKNYRQVPEFQTLIFQETMRNVRLMFDLILAEDSLPHLAVLYRNADILEKCECPVMCKDRAGRNPLHLASSWGVRYSPLKIAKRSGVVVVGGLILEEDDFFEQEKREHGRILRYLIDHCNPEERDELYGVDSFWYADKSLSLFPLEIFAEKYKIKLKNLKNFDIGTICCYCAIYGFAKLFKRIKNIPLIKTQDGWSLFSLAVYFNRKDIVEHLLNFKIYRNIIINDEDYNKTPIRIAASQNNKDIFTLLLRAESK